MRSSASKRPRLLPTPDEEGRGNVATNMAGRGWTFLFLEDGVVDLGGLAG